MCGINGIFAYHPASGEPSESELLATREAMRARGPDGSGSWWSADRRCGLGHRRLSILDISERGAQPMVSSDGRYVVSFNGEIYNFPELRSELEKEGVRFRTTCDTEALLHLYARHGEGMARRLRGMFAFAIWDSAKQGLLLARDPYGIKPLYTANDGWTFRFASQVKALLAGGAVSRDPEPAGLVGYHLFGTTPEPFTLYREIRAVPAGHTQWVDGAGAREPRQFAKLSEAIEQGSHNPRRAVDLDERLRASARESLRVHLQADVEVGIFLSGGVDSGALLGLMGEVAPGRIRAITLGFDVFAGTAEDEITPAAVSARHYGAEHIVRRVTEKEFLQDLPAILESMDQPSIDGLNTWFVSKAAREAGLKVAISGLGGDELLGGYPSAMDLPRWRRRFGALASVPGLGRLARVTAAIAAPGLARRQPKALGLLEHSGSWGGAYLLRRGLFLPHELRGLMDAEVAREGLRRLDPVGRMAGTLTPDPGSDMGRVCALESAHYMRNQLLRDADWAGMAHSLEIRTPLVDFTLLNELSPSMPALRPGAGKRALANAPSRALPEQLLTRPKTGFGVPTRVWMEASGMPEGNVQDSKGLVSRRWLRVVLEHMVPQADRGWRVRTA